MQERGIEVYRKSGGRQEEVRCVRELCREGVPSPPIFSHAWAIRKAFSVNHPPLLLDPKGLPVVLCRRLALRILYSFTFLSGPVVMMSDVGWFPGHKP